MSAGLDKPPRKAQRRGPGRWVPGAGPLRCRGWSSGHPGRALPNLGRAWPPFFRGNLARGLALFPPCFTGPTVCQFPRPKLGLAGAGSPFPPSLNGHGAAPGPAVSAVPERPAFRFFRREPQPTINLPSPCPGLSSVPMQHKSPLTDTFSQPIVSACSAILRDGNPALRFLQCGSMRNAVPDRRQRLGPGHLFQVPDSPHNPPSLPMNCAFPTGYGCPFFGQSFTRTDTPCPRYARRNGAASSLSRGRVAGANRREPKQGGLGPKSWPGRLQLDPMRAGCAKAWGWVGFPLEGLSWQGRVPPKGGRAPSGITLVIPGRKFSLCPSTV